MVLLNRCIYTHHAINVINECLAATRYLCRYAARLWTDDLGALGARGPGARAPMAPLVVLGKPNHLLLHMISSNFRWVFSSSKQATKGRQMSVLVGYEVNRTNINSKRTRLPPPAVLQNQHQTVTRSFSIERITCVLVGYFLMWNYFDETNIPTHHI